MRAAVLLVLLAVLAVCASAVRISDSGKLGVDVPYKWCGSASDDATIQSIQSNEFPPVKGDTLSLNVTGNLTKEVTAGTYTISISLGGFPLPGITGDIAAFHPLPWALGELNFTYSQEIPSESPSGNYQVKISAVDQDKTQIFCITIAFALSANEQQSAHLQLEAVASKAEQLVAEQLELDTEIVNRRPANTRVPAIQNLRRSMRNLKPMKPMKSNRRL